MDGRTHVLAHAQPKLQIVATMSRLQQAGSTKIIEPERDSVNAQLGIELINSTKFLQNPTKGFGETTRKNFQGK